MDPKTQKGQSQAAIPVFIFITNPDVFAFVVVVSVVASFPFFLSLASVWSALSPSTHVSMCGLGVLGRVDCGLLSLCCGVRVSQSTEILWLTGDTLSRYSSESLCLSLSVFDTAFTRSWFGPDRKERIRSSQSFLPCGREDCRSSVSGQCKTQEFSPLLQ